jgi:hypothetical protein
VLQETQRYSWRMIWDEEMAVRFTSAGKPEPNPEIAQITVPAVPKQAPSETEAAKSEPKATISKHSVFHGLKRAAEVYAIYSSGDTRSTILAASSTLRMAPQAEEYEQSHAQAVEELEHLIHHRCFHTYATAMMQASVAFAQPLQIHWPWRTAAPGDAAPPRGSCRWVAC